MQIDARLAAHAAPLVRATAREKLLVIGYFASIVIATMGWLYTSRPRRILLGCLVD